MTAKLESRSAFLPLHLKEASPPLTHRRAAQAFMAMPFDAMRFQYASAVVAGLVPRSILLSAKSEQAIDRLEKLVLGPVARRR